MKLFIYSLFSLYLLSCATNKLIIPPNSRSSDYNRALKENSKSDFRYISFENQISARATKNSSGFRSTLNQELTNLYGQTFPVGAQELKLENCVIYLSLSTPNYDEANLKIKKNALNVDVTQNSQTYQAVNIRKYDDSPVYREFFPYVDPWSMNYIVEFNELNCDQSFDLKIHSPKALLELKFD